MKKEQGNRAYQYGKIKRGKRIERTDVEAEGKTEYYVIKIAT